jgi:DNA-binding CsgD family transcriptional regulator
VHFERAGLRAQAYRAALTGARAAGEVSSRREAFELYARAVRNAPAELSELELADLYMGYADAAGAVDDDEAMRSASITARTHYLEAGERLRAAECLVTLINAAYRQAAPLTERLALAEAAEAELSSLPESNEQHLLLCDLWLFRAVWALDGPRLADAAHAFERAVGELEALDPTFAASNPDVPFYRRDLEYWQAQLDVLRGNVEAGLQATIAVARAARDEHLESSGVTAFRNSAMLGVRVMDYNTARLGLEEGLRYADEIEQSFCRHVMGSVTAHVLWAEGRWDDARTVAELEVVEPGGRRGMLPALDALAFVALGRGEHERARQLLDQSLEAGLEAGAGYLVLPARWGLAELAVQAGTPDLALVQCAAAADMADATDERALLVPFVVTGTRAALAARRPDQAERWLERMSALLVDWPRQARPALDHAEGLLRTASGSTVVARGLLEAAIAGWDAVGRTWEGQWARLDLAACLLRSNRDAEAVAVIRDVAARADALASAPLRRRADDLLEIARSRGAEEEPWRPLTAREFEVARLVADGLTNGAIGDQLGLSPRTVGAHVEHILAKLGFTRRAEIAAWVAGMGVAAAVG